MMKMTSWRTLAGLLLLTGSVAVFAGGAPARLPAQDDVEQGEFDEQEEIERELESLEIRLNQIEEAIDRASQQGDQQLVRELRAEGERLLDELDQLERSRQVDDDFEDEEFEAVEWERRELEMHRLQLEIEILQTQLQAVQQESALRIARISSDRLASVSYAITQALQQMDEYEAIEFLEKLREEVQEPVIPRVIAHHLAQLKFHSERHDESLDELRSLILED